jgi:thiol-disulfide isomerase/thioredoxin
MKNTFVWAASLLTLLGAASACSNSNEVAVVGKVEGADTLYISRVTAQKVVPVDTVVLTGGFKINLPTDSGRVAFYNLRFNTQASVRIGLSPGDAPVLDIDARQYLATYTVSGSAHSEQLARLYAPLRRAMLDLDSLDQVNQLYRDSANYRDIVNGLNILFGQTLERHRGQLIAAMNQDTTSLSNLFAFYQGIAQNNTLVPERDLDLFVKTNERLNRHHPGHPLVKRFDQDVQALQTAADRGKQVSQAKESIVPGAAFPWQALKGKKPDGSTFFPAAVQGKSKYLLIDVWAAWCPPCRTQNRAWATLHAKYGSTTLQIISYSLDGTPNQANPQEEWISALQADGLVWPHQVSSLQGWEDPLVGALGIESLPFSLLVDQKGTILLRNPSPEEVARKLAGK